MADVCIRWMIRKDMPRVLAIENECFPTPWSEEEFIHCLRQRNSIGMVAEVGDEIAGYMIYELHKTRLHLMSFGVAKSYRRQGVGRAMVEKLVSKLSYQRRTRVMLEVGESNLDAQLFFSCYGLQGNHSAAEFLRRNGTGRLRHAISVRSN